MAYISSFTYCDSIQTEFTPQGPKSTIVTPLQVLAPIAIPGNYSFAIACAVAGFDETVENTVRVQFLTESGQVINDTGDITFQAPPEAVVPNHPAIMQFNLDFRNMVLPETGLYSTAVVVNGEKIGEYKIPVIQGERK